MSFRNKLRDQSTVILRESLTYDEKVATQIGKCLDALNENNVEYMQASIRALTVMIPTALLDEQFKQQSLDLDDDWDVKKQEMKEAYEKELAECMDGCPDLVRPPILQPNREYWEELLQVCIDLFQRKGVGFKIELNDSI